MTAAGGPPAPAGVCGIGVDAVDIDRFRRVLERRPALRHRLFTEAEQAYADTARDPGPRLAVRFAAKEAVLKALGVGVGAAAFRDIEVVRGEEGEPGVALAGRAAALAGTRGVGRWHLSLSHTDTVAVASVVAEGSAPAAGPGPGPARGGAARPGGEAGG